MNDLSSATSGEGELLVERSMDLIHLYEMMRVCGDPSSSAATTASSFLSKYGEGGSGVHAHRYIMTTTTTTTEQKKKITPHHHHQKLKLLCECEKEFEKREKDIIRVVTANQKVNDDDENHRSPSPDDTAKIEEMLSLNQEYQTILEVEQERKQILQQQCENNAAIFHFCCNCQRIAFIPEEFSENNGKRDLYEESMRKFGVGDEYGVEQFVSFIRSCVVWEPSRRLKAAQLLSHPFLSIWAMKKFSD